MDTSSHPQSSVSPNPRRQTQGITLSVGMFRTLLVMVILLCIIVGGASGILFSGWMRADSSAASWIDQTFFGNVAGSENSRSEKTLQVTTEESATIDVVKQASPAVVSIVISQDLRTLYNQTGPGQFPFEDFFGFGAQTQIPTPEGKQTIGAGTGFIIGSDGLIVTNKHVVSDESADYTVVMQDGTQYVATVMDTDPLNDLAVLDIEATDLPTLKLGDSSSLQIGQFVIAIGNTLGEYSNTVTRGVVSGLARTVTAGDGSGSSETLEDIIQTDAAINQGNSGGPLLNLSGEVIGVNTAVSREGQLVGFAIPINQTKLVIDSVREFGRIIRPYLGVRYMPITAEIAERNSLDVDYGALIIRGERSADLAIVPGSPADKAGLVENDIILELDSTRIDADHSLVQALQSHASGDTVTLKVLSKGIEKTVDVILEELPDS